MMNPVGCAGGSAMIGVGVAQLGALRAPPQRSALRPVDQKRARTVVAVVAGD